MLRNVIQNCARHASTKIRSFSSVANIEHKVTSTDEIVDAQTPINDAKPSVLDKCQEDISHVAPFLRPSFNFAAYVNKSDTLQQLLKLGIRLYKWEKNAEIPPFILQLDFERDIKNYIVFLSDLGLQTEDMGKLIENYPFIFKEDLDNLHVRINYLKYKRFTDDVILRILQDDPLWLSFSTQEIDQKLGFFQKNFGLTGNEVRTLVAKKPKLITHDQKKIKLNMFVIKEEMGFTPDEMKQILLHKPKLFMNNQHRILKTFEYVHREMKIPLETIVKVPQILTCREFRIKQRHQFLEKLGKIQFDPKKTNYISLVALVSGTDAHFATEVAGSSVHAYNAFLKSL